MLETQNPCAVFIAYDLGYTNFSGFKSCVKVQELFWLQSISLVRTVLGVHILKTRAAAFF